MKKQLLALTFLCLSAVVGYSQDWAYTAGNYTYNHIRVQADAELANGWIRGQFGQNIYWNTSTDRWEQPSTYWDDFAMIRFENSGGFGFFTKPATPQGQTSYTNAEVSNFQRMFISNYGDVGINTSSPQYKLDVNGTINANEILVNGQPIGGGSGGNDSWSNSSDNFTSGKLGVGGSPGEYSFHVNKVRTGSWQALFDNNNGGTNRAQVLLAHGSGYGTWIKTFNSSDSKYSLALLNPSGTTNIFFNSGRTALGLMGNVGVGTSNPSYKLDVNGTINATELRVNGQVINPGGGSGGGSWSNVGDNYSTGSLSIGNSNNFGYRFNVLKTRPGAWQSNFENNNGGDNRSQVLLAHGGGYGALIRAHNSSDSKYVLALYNATTTSSIFYNSGRIGLGLTGGNVGIGTSSPVTQLHLKKTGSNVDNYMRIEADGLTYQLGINNASDNNNDNNAFSMGRIDNNGNFLQLFQIFNDRVALGTSADGFCNTFVYNELEIGGTFPGSCPDYVFAEDYKLRSIDELEMFIKTNHHLPGVKSAAEFDETGYGVVETGFSLLEKVEELTLYTIEQHKELQEKEAEIIQLEKKLTQQEDLLQNLLQRVALLEKQ